jgi:tetratricopeptide (TPR) repeat protein
MRSNLDLVFKLHVVRNPACSGDSAFALWPEPDAMNALDRHLAASGITGAELFKAYSRFAQMHVNLPWAIVIWPRCYPLAGHFAELRYMRQNFSLSNIELWQGKPLDDKQLHDLQILTFWRKPVMEDIAARSPAIASAWEVLKDKPPTGFWLCLASPPPEDWIESASLDNLIRYRKATPEKRPPPAFNPAILRSPLDQWRYWTAKEFDTANQKIAAADLFAELCRDYPNEARLWAHQGFCRLIDQPEKSISAYGQALKINPNWLHAQIFLAKAYQHQGDIYTARHLLEDVLAKDPFDRLAAEWLLDIIEKQAPEERNDGYHLTLATRYTGLEPRKAHAWYLLGFCHALAKRYEYWNNLAYCKMMVGADLVEAEVLCRKAISLNPYLGNLWDTLGLIYSRKGLLPEALTYFQSAVELNPTLVDSWQNLAHTCQELGDLLGAAAAEAQIAKLSQSEL